MPKLIPPIYFHNNCTRYSEYKNTALDRAVFSNKTLFLYIRYVFTPVMNKSPHVIHIKICRQILL